MVKTFVWAGGGKWDRSTFSSSSCVSYEDVDLGWKSCRIVGCKWGKEVRMVCRKRW